MLSGLDARLHTILNNALVLFFSLISRRLKQKNYILLLKALTTRSEVIQHKFNRQVILVQLFLSQN